jgi:hypothetical protein
MDPKKSLFLKDFNNYIAAVLLLFANLCRGRNKKSLEEIKTLGLSDHHII